jgi:hypothetical protein
MIKKSLHAKIDLRFLGWALIAIYTFILPDAILVYRKIVSLFGQDAAGKVPPVAAGLLALAYIFILFALKRSWKNLLYLIPCGLITFVIFTTEPNPNKHIHIPEYVLMAWLLYWVLSRDIKGREIFLLVFLLASLLGVVDELEQGIHPSRFYGASDMLVNTASALVGVLIIMGLTSARKSNWGWFKGLKKIKNLAWMAGLGLFLVMLMCGFLFRVQADDKFWGIYPTWLWVGNVIYLIGTLILGIQYFRKVQIKRTYRSRQPDDDSTAEKQARLWVMPLLIILFYMQVLVVYVSIAGVEFS